MSGSKAKEFRNRKLNALGEQQKQQGLQVQQMLMSLSMKLFKMDQQLQSLSQAATIAKVADWRSLALQKLLADKGITEDMVVAKVMELQEAHFEEQSAADDKERNLVAPAPETAAEKGMYAITTIKLYKDGKELDTQRVVRSKVAIGKKELVEELDNSLLGMKAGETKRFALNLGDKTDEAEVTLLGLRVEGPKPAETPAEGSTPANA